jgi:hypothetical protein
MPVDEIPSELSVSPREHHRLKQTLDESWHGRTPHRARALDQR